jgi:hypothetical protein
MMSQIASVLTQLTSMIQKLIDMVQNMGGAGGASSGA